MNKLLHIDQFNQMIDSYKPSKESKELLKKNDLVVLVAPSSTGRNTIINKLALTNQFEFIVTDTTRQPRINNGILEKNGEHYFFKTEEQFLEGLKKGQYLEAELIHSQQVSGINIDQLKKAYDQNKISITDIDIGGVENIIKMKPDTTVILLLPPDFNEWLNRINNRGHMPDDELRKRLKTAIKILEAGLEIPYFNILVNSNIDQTVGWIKDISIAKKYHKLDEKNQNVIKNLIKSTINFLEKSN